MSEAEWGAEVFPEIQPVLLRNGHKHIDYRWIKLAPGAALNLVAGMGHGQGSAVGTVADHGIHRIRDGKDARTERNLFTLQSAGVARAVKKLLVRENDLRGVAQKRNANQHVVADLAVFAHDLFFVVVQGTWFAQDAVGNGHLADIVEESGARQDGQIGIRHGHGPGDGYAKRSDPLAMSFRFGIFQVQRASEGFERVVVGLLEFHVLCRELRGALLDELLEVALIIAVFDDQPAVLQRPPNAQKELVLFEGLEDVVISAAANGFQ